MNKRLLHRKIRSCEVVVMGGSMGGTTATQAVLRGLDGEFTKPLLIALHRHSTSTEVFARVLEKATDREVFDAEDGMPIRPGKVYVAPADYHLLLERGVCRLSVDDRVQFVRPSIDVLFESAADAYGERVIGIVLTGANEDGAAGARAIKKKRGVVIVQDPLTAESPAMPNAAVPSADVVLALDDIPRLLVESGRGVELRKHGKRSAAQDPGS